jgi:thymidine phosphorylase
MQVLIGEATEPGLREVTLALAADLLVLAGVVQDQAAAATAAVRALESGAAAERFARMVAALGGPRDLLENPDHHLPRAPVRQEVRLDQAGAVATIDARALGLAVVALGGGRRRATDTIDPAVGLAEVRGIGEAVGPDVPFAIVHAASASDAAAAVEVVRGAVGVVDRATGPASARIIERIPASAIQP